MDFAQTEPALAVLRLAALFGDAEGEPDAETLAAMTTQTRDGVFAEVGPRETWPELARALMARRPGNAFGALRDCGALAQVLPEVSVLFGVPQICDEPTPVDIGEHMLRALDEAARCNAPLAARFALLVLNVGKADSPREHLPSHYRHIERGLPRVKAICERFATPAECRDLAMLAVAECERVHRVSTLRAGPVALLLERVGAFEASERFDRLMQVCACDYRAYGARSGARYRKGELLEIARAACAALAAAGAAEGDDAQTARALAVAQAFRALGGADHAA
jgi:tRNA nucleotidyltransferase (CCA-adding enzyme)